MQRIMARLASLICTRQPPMRTPERSLDPRLVVPICMVSHGATLHELGNAVNLHSESVDKQDSIHTLSLASVKSYYESTWRPSLHDTREFSSAPQFLRTILTVPVASESC